MRGLGTLQFGIEGTQFKEELLRQDILCRPPHAINQRQSQHQIGQNQTVNHIQINSSAFIRNSICTHIKRQ